MIYNINIICYISTKYTNINVPNTLTIIYIIAMSGKHVQPLAVKPLFPCLCICMSRSKIICLQTPRYVNQNVDECKYALAAATFLFLFSQIVQEKHMLISHPVCSSAPQFLFYLAKYITFTIGKQFINLPHIINALLQENKYDTT